MELVVTFPEGGKEKERRVEWCRDEGAICGDERMSVALLAWCGGDDFKVI